MATVKIYANDFAYTSNFSPNSNDRVSSLVRIVRERIDGKYKSSKLFLSFLGDSEIIGKKIISCALYVNCVRSSEKSSVYVRYIANKYDINSVSENNLPDIVGNYIYEYAAIQANGWNSIALADDGTSDYQRFKWVFDNGIFLDADTYEYAPVDVYTVNSSNCPYILAEIGDPDAYFDTLSPQRGYAAKHSPTVFSWSFKSDDYVIGQIQQSSGTLQWRTGTSGTINSINIGTSQRYTVPAGTFTSDSIQWRVSVVVSGKTLTSDWYTLSTVEPTSTAEPLAPIGGFVDSTKPIAFSWNHTIETGTDQTAFDLQYSADGSQFTTVASETTANEYTVVPAGTFAPGPLYWRVRTYNTDGAAGAWSTVMQTTAIGAPEAPVVTLDDTSPRPSVRWQSSGQQAYEVRIDGETVAKAFGVTKTYRAGTYLADGQHSISVRVQSQYGLWSEWGTVSVQIANMAGSAITLTATGGNQAALTWTTEGAYDKYYIYRDGELIAKTTAASYDDALTNDAHIYQVRGAYDSSGDYGLSNAVNVVVRPETVTIATVDGATSISLPYSETNKRTTTTNTQRQMTAMYFAGSPLPSMEIAEWTDRSMTITAALKPDESKTALMSLVGKIVCARDQYGNCVIGPLPGWTIRDYEMYTAIQTTIQDVNWREAIKHDPIT